ncbi:MAG TPA: hypothetical protein PKY46_00945 [Ignavibacteriaceae bacterium]|nr:hypothetical protein [Ignavibacteriaceae bacterium]
MKRSALFVLFLLLIVITAYAASAWVENATVSQSSSAKTVYFEASLASTDTLTSNLFSFEDYGQVVKGAFLISSVAGVPKIKLVKQESWFDGEWSTTKTIWNDSTEYQTTFGDTILTNTRYVFIGVTGNQTDSYLKTIIKGYQ